MLRSPIGRYPTPVTGGKPFGAEGPEIWIKNDGLTHETYGGNKVRKLERILPEAHRRGAKRLLTAGAAGSHHVLACTVFGRRSGLDVAAVLLPQPHNPHAEATLRAAVRQGLEAHPASSAFQLPRHLLRLRRPGDYLVPPGGLGLTGALGYVDATRELAAQIEAGDAPEPEAMVAAVGTGGTAAGLLAGLALTGMSSRVVGVQVVPNPAARATICTLAWRAVRQLGGRASLRDLSARLELDPLRLGRGYGWATEEAERAMRLGRAAGLDLEVTYTAKAFAGALGLLYFPGFRPLHPKDKLARPPRTLYWHTLSAAPLGPLLGDASSEAELEGALRALLLPAPARPGSPSRS